ncbi:MAG: GlsB/YeaQ/YmgE family stress response membrane protein [Candidatus Andersenbacteria bacterium]
MNMPALIWALIIGAIAGWLAGLIMKGRGFGVIGNVIVGILGALLGSFLFGQLGVGGGESVIGQIIVATIGAIILLFLISLVRRT